MLVAKCAWGGKRYMAYTVDKELRNEFQCPSCGYGVVLRRGRNTIPHFAHLSGIECSHGEGESIQHESTKMELYRSLLEWADYAAVEYGVGNRIVDVYFEVGDLKIALEIQHSNISVEEIKQRTMDIYKEGVVVLWLPLLKGGDPPRQGGLFSPPPWMKWIHTCGYGKVLIPTGVKDELIPVSFMRESRHIDQTEYGGGYDKFYVKRRRMKVFKSLCLGILDTSSRKKDTKYADIPEHVTLTAKGYLLIEAPKPTSRWSR